MKQILAFLSWFLLFCFHSNAQLLQANFIAEECIKVLYRQGFDTLDDFSSWNLTSLNTHNTWHLNNPRKTGVPTFSSVNSESEKSLAIFYDSQSQQKEILTSPEFLIESESSCSFYACFDGVFILFANFTLDIMNLETKERNTLFNAFLWSQENGHETPKWLFFTCDLSEYEGQKVKFIFTYEGIDGDDFLLDDFCISRFSNDENAVAEIKEGENVHFTDISAGNPVYWEWEFEGGEPAMSDKQNPVVIYHTSGTYPVKLTIRDAKGNSECLKENFVVVKGVAPIAVIGWPEDGYLSPYRGIFVPIDMDIQFTDQSRHLPTQWQWLFPGSSQEVSTEQHPVIRYDKEGVYNVTLKVSNSTGTDVLVQEDFLQVGGKQYIWNIEIEESAYINAIPLGWFGYYGGTNWLGMNAFAEYFNKPLEEGTITEVGVYFAYTETINPDASITVSIAKVENGLPGEKIASSTLLASELKYNEEMWVATDFKFETPVEIKEEFFVVIEGFPNNSSDNGTDNIAMGCTTTRSEGGKSTVYHLLELEDDNYQPTGEYQWFKNKDESLSFAITPLFTYKEKQPPAGIDTYHPGDEPLCNFIVKDHIEWIDADKIGQVSVYTFSGERIYFSEYPSAINVTQWAKGVYIVKAVKENKVVIQKIQVIP